MKKASLLFITSFIFYLIGHILWSFAIIIPKPFFNNQDLENGVISIPFLFFAVFGLIGSIRLYQSNK